MTAERSRQRIERAIAFIETKLEREVTIPDIAAVAIMSPWYFSRLFRMATGVTVVDYVRRRRLTEAARRLVATEESILDLAIRYDFGSQQSFTRAFKQYFGSPPGEVRRTGLQPANLQEVISVTLPEHAPSTLVGEPDIREIDSLTLCGVAETFDMESRSAGIPALWSRFAPLISKIPGQIGTATYGACVSFGKHGDEFRYAAAVEVASGTEPADGMETATIPAGTYAVFTHRGPTSRIKDTVEYIWATWLPGNGRWQHRMAPDFEYYDERFDPVAETGEMDIYVPVDPVS